MKIVLENIQSIGYAEYAFPKTGFVKISGGNSNGKSILIKTLEAIVTMNILDAEARRALINDDCIEGKVVIEEDGKVLAIKLHEDRNSCYVGLRRVDGEWVIRTFREGGIEELLNEFGFRVYNKNQVCLQIYETFGPMPFVNTSPVTNGEIVEAVTEDSVAKDFLTKFKEITHKKAKGLISGLNDKISTWERAKAAINLFDYKVYEAFSERLNKLLGIVEHLEPLDFEEFDVPPDVKFIDLPELELEFIPPPPKVAVVDVTPVYLGDIELDDVLTYEPALSVEMSVIEDLHTLLNGVCPTCGKSFAL